MDFLEGSTYTEEVGAGEYVKVIIAEFYIFIFNVFILILNIILKYNILSKIFQRNYLVFSLKYYVLNVICVLE